jgi:hypothetical protein
LLSAALSPSLRASPSLLGESLAGDSAGGLLPPQAAAKSDRNSANGTCFVNMSRVLTEKAQRRNGSAAGARTSEIDLVSIFRRSHAT